MTELSCWLYTGERQATKLRRKYLEAILAQEVGYFETDGNTAEISNSLTDSIEEIQKGIGEKVQYTVPLHKHNYVRGLIDTKLFEIPSCRDGMKVTHYSLNDRRTRCAPGI